MRVALLGSLLALLAVVAAGAAIERGQPRLGDRALLHPPEGSSGDAFAARYDARWWARQKQPPPPRWWEPWLPRWLLPGSVEGSLPPPVLGPERTVRVAPVLPDGRGMGAPAELRMPQSALASELGAGGLTAAVNPVDPGDNSFFHYNSSAMTPLVPLWLSWMTDAARMANRSHGLDFETAWMLSSYVAISYCNASSIAAWNCTRCGGASAGFATEEVIFDDLWDLQAYVGYSHPLDAIVIAFRGTDSHSIYNWVQNMRTWRTDLALNYPGAPDHALVHGGFLYSYNASDLAANITAAVRRLRDAHPRAILYAAGHSMGGALATLCALDMKLNVGVPEVRLYTFGSPRVGNQVFADWFESQIQVHWRFTHNRDIVPSVPPGYMGFHHLSREVWVVDLLFGHTLVGVCDATGEDVACHNSMCHLGLCSSVADHLLYLSEMYSPHPGGC